MKIYYMTLCLLLALSLAKSSEAAIQGQVMKPLIRRGVATGIAASVVLSSGLGYAKADIPPPNVPLPLNDIGAVREGISSGAAMVPGFGPKDVVYPAGFAGRWKVTQTITAVEDTRKEVKPTVPFVDALLARGPGDITFEREYIRKNGEIILERAGAATNFKKVLLGETAKSQWDPMNPNILTSTEISKSTAENPLIEEVIVTKRSQESSSTTRELEQTINTEVQMGYSEFSRVSVGEIDMDVTKATSVPKVISQRLLARYKYDDNAAADTSSMSKSLTSLPANGVEVARDSIVGVERLYIYPGDTLDIGAKKPIITFKSKVRMQRIK